MFKCPKCDFESKTGGLCPCGDQSGLPTVLVEQIEDLPELEIRKLPDHAEVNCE